MTAHRKRADGRVVVAAALLLTLAGCADNDPLSPVDDQPTRDTNTPSVLVQAHAEALEAMDLDRYAALLEAPSGRSLGFRFIPLEHVAEDLPWIPSSGWNYDMEVGMVGHMMDPDFASTMIGESVHRMVVECAITNERSLDGDGVEVACAADIQIFWSVDRSSYVETRFVMTLFPDSDGFLRIRTLQEVPRFLGRSDPSPTAPSWGDVKALFRTPPLRDFVLPSELVQAHAEALVNKDLFSYAALLEAPSGESEGFRFIPRGDDAGEFPWIPETGWDSGIELGIIGHMMNPAFVSAETGGSVINLQMNLSITDTRNIEGGGTEVACSADILVLWGASVGARVDSRLLFALFPDSEGFLRIRSIEELGLFGPRVESVSWGIIKGLYR